MSKRSLLAAIQKGGFESSYRQQFIPTKKCLRRLNLIGLVLSGSDYFPGD
jgi:hypothetical protein